MAKKNDGHKSPQTDSRHAGHDHGDGAHDDHGDHHPDRPDECCCCPVHDYGRVDPRFEAWPDVPHEQMTFDTPARFAVPADTLNRIDAFARTQHLREPIAADQILGSEFRAAAIRTSTTLESLFPRRTFTAREATTVVNRNFVSLLRARPRKNQRLLTDAEKRDFNQAVSMMIDAGQWAWFTDIHRGQYAMHGFMNPPPPAPPLGTYRFLPWHRVYMYRLEVWLNFFVPGVTIPYWDWANDREIPSWVFVPPGITRGPDTTRVMATQSQINANVLSRADYTAFSQSLEQYHNTVHMFVGGNTMPNPAVSAGDPVFYLHHANVDRIWAQWQETPGRPEAPLAGNDAFMTPFTNYHVSGTRDTFDFGYYYE